ncbi:MAG TPA: RNA-binding protein [Candidatus Babeliales bacterium]|nr:RNA-binding protein [Candidatus Babeliales bacterium]
MNKFNIYVGNVASTVTEDQLRNLFAQYGHVLSVKVMKDKFTGEARGFAFVEMASSEEGQAAIAAINGNELNGQRLRVNEARPREERGAGDRPRRPFNNNNRFPRY